jgi:hypothetical protein
LPRGSAWRRAWDSTPEIADDPGDDDWIAWQFTVELVRHGPADLRRFRDQAPTGAAGASTIRAIDSRSTCACVPIGFALILARRFVEPSPVVRYPFCELTSSVTYGKNKRSA